MAGEISLDFIENQGNTIVSSSAAIDQFFAARQGGASFIQWFNQNVGNRDAWLHKRIPASPECAAHFKTFWDGATDVFGNAPNMVQFICLMSIFINEVGGDLVPIQEKVGLQSHPGIAYAFDRIRNLKQSYNTMAGNRTAFDLFRDQTYRAAHGKKALAERFASPSDVDPAWKGEVWPGDFPTSTDPEQTGFLLEADFYKFRGRGLIQTTGRANYLKLIEFVKQYHGTDTVIREFADRWATTEPDTVATTSSNDDWHSLFMSPSLELAREAIKLHNKASGNYLNLAVADPATLTALGSQPGSIFRMGKRISRRRRIRCPVQAARAADIWTSVGADGLTAFADREDGDAGSNSVTKV